MASLLQYNPPNDAMCFSHESLLFKMIVLHDSTKAKKEKKEKRFYLRNSIKENNKNLDI